MLPGIGVFGTDDRVKVMVRLLRDKGFKVEALWGRTAHEASETSRQLDIGFHSQRIDDVLLRKDVDLILIVCSPSLQAQIAVKALGIGKHVLCDKPSGLCESEALKMVRAAQYYPTLISIVNYSLRFLPAFCHMKKLLQQGYVGRQVRVIECSVRAGTLYGERYDWQCDESMGGGVLTLVGSHLIDLITHLTSQTATHVHALLRTLTTSNNNISGIRRISSPDLCCVEMEMSGGAVAVMRLMSEVPGGDFSQEVMVCGEAGYLAVRGTSLYGCTTGTAVDPRSKEQLIYSDDGSESSSPKETPASAIPPPYLKGLERMMGGVREAFLPVEDKHGWVKEPVADAATFEDGLYVQAVIEALRRSSQDRTWHRVQVMREEPDPNPALSAAVRRSGISV